MYAVPFSNVNDWILMWRYFAFAPLHILDSHLLFSMNMYALLFSNVNDWIFRRYATIWEGALGNYRELSRKMFVDGALRKSLDQLENPPCDLAPIENFGREWFER